MDVDWDYDNLDWYAHRAIIINDSYILTRKVLFEKRKLDTINLLLTSVPVQMETRTLRALWSPSLLDDLLNYPTPLK